MEPNYLFNIEHAIRREIYGYSFIVDEDKKISLVENLKQIDPNILLSEDYSTNLEPLIDKLCSFEHVKIVTSPGFVIFEMVENPASTYPMELHSRPLMTTLHLVASFSGFVDQVEKDISYGGHPKYYYIHSISASDQKKIVRYTTYVTGNKLIDGPGKKTSRSKIFKGHA